VIEDEKLCDRANMTGASLTPVKAVPCRNAGCWSDPAALLPCCHCGNPIRILSPLTIDMDHLHERFEILEVALRA
jgi:hypothetical protein